MVELPRWLALALSLLALVGIITFPALLAVWWRWFQVRVLGRDRWEVLNLPRRPPNVQGLDFGGDDG